MQQKINPLWWPALLLASPAILPYLYYKNESYKLCIDNIGRINQERIDKAENLNLKEVKDFSLTAVVEAKGDRDFNTEAGISYFLETDNSKLLFDIAFAGESNAFAENFSKLKLEEKDFKQLVISHLHPDHMGGIHLPVKNGRLKKAGIDFQRIVGTGLRPWKKIDDNYLNQKISVLKDFHVKKVFLSPHDSSDYSLTYFKRNLGAEVRTIKSGEIYDF